MRAILLLLVATLFISTGCKQDCTNTLDITVDNEQLELDKAAIDSYLEQHSIEASTHSSGIRYVISRAGEGDSPDLCSSVMVTYEGKLLSTGAVFDKSSDPVLFSLDRLIPGWQIGLPLIAQGGRITLYIPSVYAYGSAGAGSSIPPNSNLIFEVNLIDVR